MGCPRKIRISEDQYLTFSICTHNSDTGILTDCDTDPSYRIYEEETVTPILTGTMSKLDDSNTTGFYSENIDINSVGEFYDNKNYTIYIEAVVSGVTGGMCYGFKAYNLISGAVLTSVSAQKPKIIASATKPKITAVRYK